MEFKNLNDINYAIIKIYNHMQYIFSIDVKNPNTFCNYIIQIHFVIVIVILNPTVIVYLNPKSINHYIFAIEFKNQNLSL